MDANDKGRPYAADGITVFYNARLCVHAAACVRGLPGVFDADARPWIRPGNATPDEIAQVIERCPTGALRYERDGGPPETARAAIAFVLDGPIAVRGEVRIRDETGRVVYEGHRAALCRCGASRNKPFCDRSHTEAGFRAEGGTLEVP